jgi:ABC-type branched-subunit amino acid transport system substrate-binding protein
VVYAAEQPAIGLLVPGDAGEATSMRQGAILGVEDANQSAGSKLRLVVRGRPGQWGTEGDEAVALALDDGALAIIAPSSGTATHQVLQVAGRTRVPVVSLCADSSVTEAGIPWAVRIAPSTVEEARLIFKQCNEVLNTGNYGVQEVRSSQRSASSAGEDRTCPVRWAAVVPSDRAGREAARDLERATREAGCRIQQPIRLPTVEADWEGLINGLRSAKGILLWADASSAGKLARELRRAGYGGLLAGPGSLDSTAFVQAAGSAAEGVMAACIALDQQAIQRQSRFEAEYRKHFGQEPDRVALLAHDAALLLGKLVQESDVQPLYRRFAGALEVPGASGTLRFDRQGNRLTRLELRVCRHGRFQPLTDDSACAQHGAKRRL